MQFLKSTILLSLFACFALYGCGNNNTGATKNSGADSTNVVASPTTDTASRPDVSGKTANPVIADTTMVSKNTPAFSRPGNTAGNEVAEDDQSAGTDTASMRKSKHHRRHKNMENGATSDGGAAAVGTGAMNDNKHGVKPPPKGTVPPKVYTVLAYVIAHGQPMPGYVGGRVFTNFEKVLPFSDASGKTIVYHEWDVNPHVQGVNRGAERLVTGVNQKYYYTSDHYVTFTQVYPK